MTPTALIALTTVAIAIVIRRITWHSDQERPITVNLALQGLAVLCMTPWASTHIGNVIYRWSGVANVEDLIAHDCYIVAGSMILLYGMWSRTQTDDELRTLFRRKVEVPCTICIPILAFVFLAGNAGGTQVPDFFALEGDMWTDLYWLMLTATITYTLGYAIFLYAGIWREMPILLGSYILSAAFGVAACAIKAVTALEPHITAPQTSGAVWVTAALCGTGFAVISGWDWWSYKHGMSKGGTGEYAAA